MFVEVLGVTLVSFGTNASRPEENFRFDQVGNASHFALRVLLEEKLKVRWL